MPSYEFQSNVTLTHAPQTYLSSRLDRVSDRDETGLQLVVVESSTRAVEVIVTAAELVQLLLANALAVARENLNAKFMQLRVFQF